MSNLREKQKPVLNLVPTCQQ